jgi:hypothetical protein
MNTQLPPIEIFRAGSFRDMAGQDHAFTAQDLDDIASSYSGADPAPLVVGHPKTDDPAYGWVDRIERDGDRLLAHSKAVDPAFAEWVAKGLFRKVSVKLHTKGSSSNPTPGKLYLKHVGFLGATAPAIPGLKPVAAFADDTDEAVVFEFATPKTTSTKETSMTDNPDLAKREAEIAAREAEIAKREAAFAETQAENRKAARTAWVDARIADGRVKPAAKTDTLAFMASIDEGDEIAFASGDMASALAWFQKQVEASEPLIAFGEAISKKAADPDNAAVGIEFADGYRADPASVKLAAKVREIKTANPNMDHLDALRRAQTAA